MSDNNGNNTANRPSTLQLTKTVESGKVTQKFTRGSSKTVTVEVRKTRTFTRNAGGNMMEDSRLPGDTSLSAEEKEALLRNVRNASKEMPQMTRDRGQINKATRNVITTADSEEVVENTVVAPAPVEKKLEIAPVAPVVETKVKAESPAEVKSEAPQPVSRNLHKASSSKPTLGGVVRNTRRPDAMSVANRQLGGAVVDNNRSSVVTAPSRRKDNVVLAPSAAAKAAPAAEKNNDNVTQNVASPAPNRPVGGPVFGPSRTASDATKEADDRNQEKKIRLKSDLSRRSSQKITVSQALEYQEERIRSMASIKRQREKTRRLEGGYGSKQEKIFREVILPESITVQELANRMAERVADVVKILMKMDIIANGSQSIDADVAELIALDLGHTVRRVAEADVESIITEESEDDSANMLPRAPVVTIMGHVDHGKTSLLDALRKTNVVAGEAGGITQHIGAYQVSAGGQKVTFLDTPGHEAFTAMRARGAKATDVVVLVVAADDGIMAQTEEAISHAKAAGVPMLVAINKIDKPAADPSRVKNELMQRGLIPEEFGGDVQVVEVSAKTGLGLDGLVEALLLQAEILELKANPNRKAAGVVVESRVDKGRGVVATLLVQKGTLETGAIVVAGSSWGKIRALTDDKGTQVPSAIPSQPVEVLGLDEPPMAGDDFAVVDSEKLARDITEYRKKRDKEKQVVVAAKSLEQLFTAASSSAVKELPMIIKGDVQGSVEAIIGSVQKFSGEEVAVKILHSGAGAISESDVSLAQATGAILFGFNVRAGVKAREMAEREKVSIRYYSVIYDLVDDVKAALSGMLSPTLRENLLGYAEIREVFNITKAGKVAGCMVTEGMIKRGAKVRLLRENVVIHEGSLKTLKRFKDEVKEVKSGYECGMAFENYEDIRAGDMIEAFEVEEVSRSV